jgi:hypothetical protein
MTSLNHNFALSERRIFLRDALDSSGKTGGGILGDCAAGGAGDDLYAYRVLRPIGTPRIFRTFSLDMPRSMPPRNSVGAGQKIFGRSLRYPVAVVLYPDVASGRSDLSPKSEVAAVVLEANVVRKIELMR